jgi:nitroreductase
MALKYAVITCKNNDMSEIITNTTIETLLNRRSIRKFKPDTIDDDTIATLETVAQHAASSQYLNDWSAIRITDAKLQRHIAQIGRQTYIAQAPLLYIFIADEHRNALIAERKGVDSNSERFTLNSSYRYSQAQNDAVLALHAMETAAYSLGLGCVILGCVILGCVILGCVILGSVLNDVDELINNLNLPEYTYPVLGLAIGKPDQQPALKPRMDRSMQFFTNTYPADDNDTAEPLALFDAEVHQYYDLRQADRPVDAFSDQIATNAVSPVANRAVGPRLRSQGFETER